MCCGVVVLKNSRWGSKMFPPVCPLRSSLIPLCILLGNPCGGIKTSILSCFFIYMLSLLLGAMSKVQMVWLPLKCTCMPKILQVFLNLSLSPLCVRFTMEMFLLLELVLLALFHWLLLTVYGLLMLCLWLNLFCSLLRAGGNCIQAVLFWWVHCQIVMLVDLNRPPVPSMPMC